jgi:hypothetical protein
VDRDRLRWTASLTAARVLRENEITSLPVDPIALAATVGIEVTAKPVSTRGVSGMLIRSGDEFAIAYATHITSKGFRHFSVAHELGHYFLEGHPDAVFDRRGIHQSRANFSSDDPYEVEADFFAAALLMPETLFAEAIGQAGDGLSGIERLAELCITSLTATAIRFAQLTESTAAVVMSKGKKVEYSFMSKPLLEIAGGNRIDKGDLLPPGTTTSDFNKDVDRVSRGDHDSGKSELQDWIGGRHQLEMTEEVVGLGDYGKTLTVLTAVEAVDMESLEEEEELVESWTPRFKR